MLLPTINGNRIQLSINWRTKKRMMARIKMIGLKFGSTRIMIQAGMAPRTGPT